MRWRVEASGGAIEMARGGKRLRWREIVPGRVEMGIWGGGGIELEAVALLDEPAEAVEAAAGLLEVVEGLEHLWEVVGGGGEEVERR